jgi:SAM-dependent methyltransferase
MLDAENVVEQQRFFTRVSALYAAETKGVAQTTRGLHRHVRTQSVLDIVRHFARPGGTIADIGCGPAQLAEPLRGSGFRYIGIDPVREMFAASEQSLAADPDAVLLVGDAENLPIEDGTVDAALLIGVIEYLPDRQAWIAEAHRVLLPGGLLVVSFPNLLNPAQALRLVTRPLLAPLIRAGRSPARATLYASRAYQRPYFPWEPIRRARALGFRLLEVTYRGYCMHVRSHPLEPGDAPAHLRRDAGRGRRLPWIGADVICALERA